MNTSSSASDNNAAAPVKKRGTSVYQIVTDRIVAMLAQGVVPWERPWICGTCAPRNRESGKEYRGVNRLLLPKPGEYMTANQVRAANGSLRDGANSIQVTFFSFVDERKKKAAEDDADETPRKDHKYPLLRYYNVYHLDDVDGVASKLDLESETGRLLSPDDEAESVIREYLARTGVRLVHQPGYHASYDAATDTITMPERKQFSNTESYYSVLFHELIHSTGSACAERLPRKVQAAAYDAEDFSREQLAAEIGSCMLLSHCDLDSLKVVRNSAGRIAGWLAALQADSRLVVSAASDAEKAVAFVLGE